MTSRILVDVYVVVLEDAVAFVTVSCECGDEVHPAAVQFYVVFVQDHFGSPFGHIVHSCKGAVHIFPVPVCIVTGIPYIESKRSYFINIYAIIHRLQNSFYIGQFQIKVSILSNL